MSRVFVATETALGRKVVVKVLSPELAAEVSGSRFEREIRLAASLQQANIVPLLSTGQFDGRPYYTMPFVDGLSLRQRLAGGRLAIPEVISVLRDVARALAYAHERGVVHRDIKPDNVLLSGDAAVVTDFGIAKALIRASTTIPGGEAAPAHDASVVTQIGTALGTPAYMAPEQSVGDPSTDHRADLYALGCLGYELLCGETPFHGRQIHQTFLAHVNETPVPIATKRPDCPPGLAQVVMLCLEKSPAQRPQSAREVLQGLDAAGSGSASSAALASWWRRPQRVLGAAIMLVVIAVVGTALARRSRGDGEDASGVRTLAVLPFLNVGGDSTQEYLADGITDELATAFGKMPGVRVAARTGAYRYRDRQDVDPREVGRTLGVGLVLQGSIRSSGQRLRASAHLSDAKDGQEVWSEDFDRDAKDLFTLESDLAAAITGALASRLSSRPANAPTARVAQGTTNPDAYRLYLRGQFLLLQRRTLPQAIGIFQQAIDADSTFARAYAALAETLEYLPYFNGVPSDSVRARSMRAAQRALLLDSNLAQAHVALGLAHMHASEWDQTGDELRLALAVDSNDVSALTQYTRYLLQVGRPAEALATITRAGRLEPFSAVVSAWTVDALSLLGRHDEAIAESKRGMQMDSASPPMIENSALAYAAAGRLDEARRIARRNPIHAPPFSTISPYVDGLAGDKATALRAARELEAQSPFPFFGWSTAAMAYLGAGDTARTLTDLERATDAHEGWAAFNSLCDQEFDPIRGSRRFAALLRRVSLDSALFTRPHSCRPN